MSDKSDSPEAEDTSNDGVSMPLLNTSVENEDELKQDSPKTSETQEATSQDASDDQIHIDDIRKGGDLDVCGTCEFVFPSFLTSFISEVL